MAGGEHSSSSSSAGVGRLDWDDLRVLLAICRSGTLAGAARSLGKDHSTLFRKLNRIEDRAGVRFFERLPSGYAMTDAGEIALAYGERIETQFHALGREIDGRDARLSGNLCLTAPEGISTLLLPPLLAEFHRQHPQVVVELVEGAGAADLSRREADVAIRATRKPPDESLGKRIGRFRFAPYAAPEYLQRAGERSLPEHDWILLMGFVEWLIPAVWKNRLHANARAVMHTNSVAAAMHAAQNGIGVTLLPCYRGDAEEALVRVGPTFDHLDMELWILTHPVLRQTARVRALMAFLIEELRHDAPLFAGEQPRG